ncbi:MAG: histidine--tRNA ligase [Acidobacteria bacterium]|nr:histidine--tRNA ligase [Acidobacteriota bacterium]
MPRTEPARGMRDFLPDDVRRREHVIGIVKRVYERYGFEPLETPAVENIDTLLGKYGDEGNKLIFKILKRGEHEASGQADLALRYDLTVPLARVVAEHQAKLPRLFKRYQIQPVWRADRPARGRFREFYQCDVDTLGSTSPVVEAELCAAVADVLSELGFNDFVIRINHRRQLTSLLRTFGIADDLHETALTAIDKLDKVGADGVAAELRERGISAECRQGFLAFHGLVTAVPPAVGASASLRMLDVAEGFLGSSTMADSSYITAHENLKRIMELTQNTSAAPRMSLDSFLARGLSYYTGAIMEVNVADLPGSLGGGGRYDDLVGMFSGQGIPACGFSLGLERILVVMAERGMFPASLAMTPADVMIATFDAGGAPHALALADRLRRAGLRVLVYPDADRIGKQIKYADSRGIPFVALLGADEIAAGTVTVKHLAAQTQQTLDQPAAAAAIREGLKTGG